MSKPRPQWTGGTWLFSAPVDLGVFLGSAVVALALLPVGAALGVLHSDSPEWTWITAVLLVDVAHVWSTTFRVYADRDELARRPWLYALVPVLAWIGGITLYSESRMLFWSVLAYLAVFHFVRQQYGWVALYRARAGECDRVGRWLDSAAVYLATIFPLVYWHAHLPRAFVWFVPGDFVTRVSAVAALATRLLEPVYYLVLAAYLGRSAYRWLTLRIANPGKDIIVITTAACWYLGIVAFDSDYAFTVTNVIIHGVPYFALIYWYGKKRWQAGQGGLVMRVFAGGPGLFLAIVWLLAYGEELLWDRAVWHDRAWLFGAGWQLESFHTLLVPLLAVPQATHYILDGFLWRRRGNPGFASAVTTAQSGLVADRASP